MSIQFLGQEPIGELHLLAERLAKSVRGQKYVIEQVVNAVGRRELEMAPPRGCRGAFLFVGPTGVGKTELGKALAQALYGEGRVIVFDVSEFAQPRSLEVALGDGGNIKGRFAIAHDVVPQGIWLFDEIEKGCDEFKNLLIQITDAGRVTLASGRVLDFSNIYILATSNLGSREILEREHLPFTSLEKHVVRCLEERLSPELLARFERPFVFRPIDWEMQKEIVGKRLDELRAWQWQRHQRAIQHDDVVIDFLIAMGFSARYGARPLLRTIDRLVGNAILHGLQGGTRPEGRLAVDGDRLILLP